MKRVIAPFLVDVVNEPIVTDKNSMTSHCPETASWRMMHVIGMLRESLALSAMRVEDYFARVISGNEMGPIGKQRIG